MTVLNNTITFPDVSNANAEGLLAIGGDLSYKRLLLAYKSGIFPWYNEGEPIMWWSPNPRFVLYPKKLKISKSSRQLLKKGLFTVTINNDFNAVINHCAKIKRCHEDGTWITNAMTKSYIKLHQLGYATSVEVWDKNNTLVGGLYGVNLGNVFCGESMFSKVSNASKIGFITFIQNTNFKLIDCQIYTQHLDSLGAEEITRDKFISYLN